MFKFKIVFAAVVALGLLLNINAMEIKDNCFECANTNGGN
jgi:hypothetical protein